MRANASSASIMLPHEPCISRPVLVEHLLVAEHLAERRPPGQRDRHEELRVEPEPDLLAHLRDPVGREPLLPGRVVGQVGGRQPLGGAGRVPLRHVLRALPAERRERDDAGVEPDVADLLDPLRPARRTRRTRSGPRRSRGGAAPRAGRARRARAPRARRASRSRSGGRTRRGRTAAAARSSGAARCSSRPCCAASRPCACPCRRASTRPSRSRRAAAARSSSTAMNQSSESRKISGVWQRQQYG